ncbi:MAG: ABC transporter substrate-binding protein [Clostridia bacterium]|nr:ABC transporter substrate-binding protein [Clostridia bacterium]
MQRSSKIVRLCLCLSTVWLMLAGILLSSCGITDPGTTSDTAIVFTDALGREVELPSVPVRTASLSGSLADLWLLAGGSLCAASEDAWEDFGYNGEDTVNIGGAHSPNTELLLSAGPDFIIASASTAAHVELLGFLESVGIPTAYFEVESFDDYLDALALCTRITGRADLYEAHGTQLYDEIAGIRTQFTSSCPEPPSILLLRASSGGVKAKGSDGTILGGMLYDLGCENIADSDTALLETLGLESILEKNPAHIFVVTMGSDTSAAMESLDALFSGNPAWQTLDAVARGRIHVMDRSLFHLKPNDRWAEAYRILYETLNDT